MLSRRGSYEFWTPPDPSTYRFGEAGGRIVLSGSDLAYVGYSTNIVEINGQNVETGSLNGCATTDDLIDNTGAGTGLFPANLARTYAYVSNSAATSLANSLRLSTSAPVDYKGFRYLNNSGNGANWRFVGWVGTLGSPSVAFRDDEAARLIVNAYNRIQKTLFLCPGYNDNNAGTTYSTNNATWTGIGVTAALTDTVAFVSDGENAINLEANVNPHTSGGSWRMGIGVASTIATARTTVLASAGLRTGLADQSSSCSIAIERASGFYFAALCSYTAGVAMTVHADQARLGSAADPYASWLTGTVMA